MHVVIQTMPSNKFQVSTSTDDCYKRTCNNASWVRWCG
jgi:hypothetical protein